MRVLVTGFGPFPRMPRNPSAATALALGSQPRLRLHGIDVRAVVLTTAYAALPRELAPLLASAPDAILLLGVAGRSGKVRVEERATSRRSVLFADACGAVSPLSADRVVERARRTRTNVVLALRHLARRRVPARRSRDAGRYLCNAAYFDALAADVPVLFVHMPMTPRGRRAGPGRIRRVGAGWSVAFRAGLVDIIVDLARARYGRSLAAG